MKKILGLLGASLMAVSVLSAAPTISKECSCPKQYCKCSSACQCGDDCSCGNSCHCK